MGKRGGGCGTRPSSVGAGGYWTGVLRLPILGGLAYTARAFGNSSLRSALPVKRLLRHIPSPLLPERLAERRRFDEHVAEVGWLKFEERQRVPVVGRPSIVRATEGAYGPLGAREVDGTDGSVAVGVALFEVEATSSEVEATISRVEPTSSEVHTAAVGTPAPTSIETAPSEVVPLPPSGTDAGAPREARSVRISDYSSLPGFGELARGARHAVREIVDAEPPSLGSVEARPTHWMAEALRRAGVPRADDLPVAPSTSAEEAWRIAEEWCGLSGDEISDLVATLFRARSVDLGAMKVERFDDVPDSLIRRYGAIPLARGDRYLLVAASDPSDQEMDRAFSFATRRSIVLAVASPAAIADAIWKTYGWMR